MIDVANLNVAISYICDKTVYCLKASESQRKTVCMYAMLSLIPPNRWFNLSPGLFCSSSSSSPSFTSQLRTRDQKFNAVFTTTRTRTSVCVGGGGGGGVLESILDMRVAYC